MGLLNKAVKLASRNSQKIKQAAEDNADKITDTVGKVTDKVDEKTQGKYRDKLDKVEGAVGKALKKDGGTDEPGPTGEPYHPEDPPGPSPAG